MLHRMEAVEHIGSGIKRIRGLCREYGVAEPRIEVSEHWFSVSFPRPAMPDDDAHSEIYDAGTKSGPSRDQVAEQVTEQVARLLLALGEQTKSGQDLMEAIGLQHRPTFLYSYLQPALGEGLVEMTIPDKPRSSKQRYRLTPKGRTLLEQLNKNKS